MLPYDRLCNRCGAPITMRLTWVGWKPFERATYTEHAHRVVRAEPIPRERVRERVVYVPAPAPSNWPERYEPRAKQKPPLHERMWVKIVGAATLAVLAAITHWLRN